MSCVLLWANEGTHSKPLQQFARCLMWCRRKSGASTSGLPGQSCFGQTGQAESGSCIILPKEQCLQPEQNVDQMCKPVVGKGDERHLHGKSSPTIAVAISTPGAWTHVSRALLSPSTFTSRQAMAGHGGLFGAGDVEQSPVAILLGAFASNPCNDALTQQEHLVANCNCSEALSHTQWSSAS